MGGVGCEHEAILQNPFSRASLYRQIYRVVCTIGTIDSSKLEQSEKIAKSSSNKTGRYSINGYKLQPSVLIVQIVLV